MSLYTDPNWLTLAAREHVAVIVNNDAPFFVTLAEFARDNADELSELASLRDGHDVTRDIFDGKDLLMGGGAAPAVRVTAAVKCQQCGVMMAEFVEASAFCKTAPCWAAARAQEIHRLGATA